MNSCGQCNEKTGDLISLKFKEDRFVKRFLFKNSKCNSISTNLMDFVCLDCYKFTQTSYKAYKKTNLQKNTI